MNKDIKALLSIYTILILVGWNIALSNEVKKEQKEKIEAMKIAVDLDNNLNDYIAMVAVMNSERDAIQDKLNEIEETNRIIKDLR